MDAEKKSICVILCGGKATRLDGINQGVPKALLNIFGRTLLSHLITNISNRFERILISYSGDKELYTNPLDEELTAWEKSKLVFEQDDLQLGTANAVTKIHTDNTGIIVMNGDTLFDEYDTIFPPSISSDNAVFSSSFQKIGRSSKLNKNEMGTFNNLSQKRLGQNNNFDWVNNGCISVDASALQKLRRTNISIGLSFEQALYQMLQAEMISIGLHRSAAKFIDIGLREDYLNAEVLYKQLINNSSASNGF